MDTIIALLNQAIGYLLTLIGIDQTTQAYILGLSLDTKLNVMQQELIELQGELTNVSDQCATILGRIGLPATDLETDHQDILTAIAATQQASLPVILPSTPPPGYGGSLDAAAVWNYAIGAQGYSTGESVTRAGALATALGLAGAYQTYGSKYVTVEGFLQDFDQQPPTAGPPYLNPANILSTDTRVDWLDREWPVTGGWQHDTFNDTYYYADNPITNQILWRCTLSALDFALIQQGLTPLGAGVFLPPVWPGIANVTLGPGIPLTPQMDVVGPMHGVNVVISSVSANKPKFPYGFALAYKGIGALSFTDDLGQQEAFQPLQFDTQVYCPRSMVLAAGMHLRCDPSVGGELQIWTINPP